MHRLKEFNGDLKTMQAPDIFQLFNTSACKDTQDVSVGKMDLVQHIFYVIK